MADLSDEETRLARFGELSSKRKAEIRAQQSRDLAEAETQRRRPLSSRALDAMYQLPFAPEKRRKETAESAAKDNAERERRYNRAKSRAGMTDEALTMERALYTDDRTHKLDDAAPLFKKGGAVKASASRRADGVAQRGKTKGRMV